MKKLRQLFTILFIGFLMTCGPLAAQTISIVRDTIHNADGTLFNGLLIISWQGFTSATGATIAPHSNSVRIISGYVSVLLVPTTNASPGAFYTAQYESSDGTVLWTETWEVPPSYTVLTISQVRVAGPPPPPPPPSYPTFVDNETPSGAVNGSNLSFTTSQAPSPAASLELYRNGLLQRPGVDYSLSGSAISFLVAATPQTGDILTAFYRTATAGSSAVFAGAEILAGAISGVNPVFTTASAPSPAGSLRLFKNGAFMRATVDYTLSGATVTFGAASIPHTGDTLVAFYRH